MASAGDQDEPRWRPVVLRLAWQQVIIHPRAGFALQPQSEIDGNPHNPDAWPRRSGVTWESYRCPRRRQTVSGWVWVNRPL